MTIKDLKRWVLAIQKNVQNLDNEFLYEQNLSMYYDSELDDLYENIKDYFVMYEYEKRLIESKFLNRELQPINLECHFWIKFKQPMYVENLNTTINSQAVSLTYNGTEFKFRGVHFQDIDENTELNENLKFTVDEDGNKINLN